jgi:carbon-monoxide dehydrogenase medium subunit
VAAGVIALGAVLRLRSPAGVRECAAEDFFIGPFMTQLAQQELLEEIEIAQPAPGDGSAYVSIEDKASGYPLAGAAVRVGPASCTVGLTGLGAHPLRLPALEQALLAGTDPGAALRGLELAAGAEDEAYRLQLAAVVVERAFAAARGRAQG